MAQPSLNPRLTHQTSRLSTALPTSDISSKIQLQLKKPDTYLSIERIQDRFIDNPYERYL